MSNVIVEIRAGEGGSHSKQLVEDQFKMYSKLCLRRSL